MKKEEKKEKPVQKPKTEKGQAIANLETQEAMAKEPYKTLIKNVRKRIEGLGKSD
jgi:hypothetical protein